jgi:hypothetical protein
MPPDEKDEPVLKAQPQGKPINEGSRIERGHPVRDGGRFQGASDERPKAPPASPPKKKD